MTRFPARASMRMHELHALLGVRMRRTVIALGLLASIGAGTIPAMVEHALAAQVKGNLARARAVLPPDAMRDLERAVEAARARGLPTEPLVDKALEGAAKGVPAERILAVVRQLAEDLERAYALVVRSGTAAPADVTAVADAIRRGVPEDAIRTLHGGSASGEPIALAVHTLADLLDRGVPVDVALDVLAAWRSFGARPDQLRELPAAVERLIREGALPAQAAAAVASAVRAGHGPAAARRPAAVPANDNRRGAGSVDQPPLPAGAPYPPRGKGKGNKPGTSGG
mgnify:CR=1 FL=1